MGLFTRILKEGAEALAAVADEGLKQLDEASRRRREFEEKAAKKVGEVLEKAAEKREEIDQRAQERLGEFVEALSMILAGPEPDFDAEETAEVKPLPGKLDKPAYQAPAATEEPKVVKPVAKKAEKPAAKTAKPKTTAKTTAKKAPAPRKKRPAAGKPATP